MARYKSAAGLVAAIVCVPLTSTAHVIVIKPLPPAEQKALQTATESYLVCLDRAAIKIDDGRSDDHLLGSKIARRCAGKYREMAIRYTAQVILKPDPHYKPSSPSHDPYAGMIPDGHIGIADNLTQAIEALRFARCDRKYGKNTSASGDCYAILDGRPGDAQDKSHSWP